MKLKEKERKVLIGILRDREYLATDFHPRHRNGSDMLSIDTAETRRTARAKGQAKKHGMELEAVIELGKKAHEM